MPVFFKQMEHVAALEVVAYRVLCALPFLLVVMALRHQLREYWQSLMQWRLLRWMLVSAALIFANWLIFIWAIAHEQIIAVSLGYYLNPLMNVAIGTLFLHERLTRRQWCAVGLAGIAVLVLATGAAETLWISISLASTFCLYGLARKFAPVDAAPGLAVETTLLLPLSLGLAIWFGAGGGPIFSDTASGGWGSDGVTTFFLATTGIVTAIPLLMFAFAARRMDYSVIGFVQYIGPTMHFLIGFLIYDEPLNTVRLAAFALIWCGLALFSSEALSKAARSRRKQPAA